MFFALMMMLTTTMAASAMSYEQARNEALFLTDKMAYELNLTDAQYEAAYEINLDYLMGVASRDDVFGIYWERRNLDLSYILFDWQWNAYIAASYFYRPLYWEAGYWHFGIYRRYPHRDYFYFGRPHFYATYRGGHAWHAHGSHGYYYGHRDHYRPAHHGNHFGMHDRWDRGDFRNPSHHSSTRVTGRPNGHSNRVGYDNRRPESRPNNGINRRPENRPESRPNNGSMERRPNTIERRPENRSNSGNFGGSRVGRGGVNSDRPYTNFGNSRNGSSSHSGSMGSHSSGSFGSSHSSGSHSGGSHSGNFGGGRSGGSHSGGSFGGGRSGGSHSSMGSSTRSGGGGGSHGGGGHFGGRR